MVILSVVSKTFSRVCGSFPLNLKSIVASEMTSFQVFRSGVSP